LRATLERERIMVVSLLDALRSDREDTARTAYYWDGHWTPHGHAVVADRLPS
jgi:hypothetical protein